MQAKTASEGKGRADSQTARPRRQPFTDKQPTSTFPRLACHFPACLPPLLLTGLPAWSLTSKELAKQFPLINDNFALQPPVISDHFALQLPVISDHLALLHIPLLC